MYKRQVLGDEGVQNAGLDHLGLDLVAVLDQGHGKGAGVLQGVGGELIEDLVVLGLLPLELHGVAWVDGLQILDEQGQGTLDVYKRQTYVLPRLLARS